MKKVDRPNLLAIRGRYESASLGRTVSVVSIDESTEQICVTDDGRSIFVTTPDDLSGPSHLPCPNCGEMRVVVTDGMQIDFAEHLMRCLYSGEAAQSLTQLSASAIRIAEFSMETNDE